MPAPGGLRFTLGQSMAVTAMVALLAYVYVVPWPGGWDNFTDPRYLVSSAIKFAGAGVLLYNRRLSPGMWIVLAGYFGEWVVGTATRLAMTIWMGANGTDQSMMFRVSSTAYTACSLLLVVGLAKTFQDIRRQLAVPADPP